MECVKKKPDSETIVSKWTNQRKALIYSKKTKNSTTIVLSEVMDNDTLNTFYASGQY